MTPDRIGVRGSSSHPPGSPSRRQSIFRAASSAVVLRVVSLACTLVQVRLVMPYLGEDRFGFWTVLLAIGSFFGLSDLGISSAFQNDVTLAEARGEQGRLRPMFFSAQATLLVLALAGAVVITGLSAAVGKATFFRHLAPDLAGQAVWLTGIFVVAVAINAPLALSGRLAFGLHLGHVTNLAGMLAQLITLPAMAAVAWLHAPFSVFLLVTIVPTIGCNLALGIWLLQRLEPSPGRTWEGLAYAKHTVRSGLQYLALGASQPFFFATAPLLLSSVFGPAVVTAYGLSTRALGVVHNFEAGILSATWPALTEALGCGDHARARRALRRNVLLTCLAFCSPVLLFPFLGPPVLALWSGLPVANFPPWIVWPVTMLFFCVLFQGPFYIFLSAAGSVVILAASHFVAAGVALVAAATFRGYPQLIPVWIAASYAAFALIPPIAQSLRILRATAAR